MIIMNNDLSGGIPDALREIKVPIFPSMHAGWHARHKSEHFRWTNLLIKELPISSVLMPGILMLNELVDHVNVNIEADRQRLYQAGVNYLRISKPNIKTWDNESRSYFIKSIPAPMAWALFRLKTPSKSLS